MSCRALLEPSAAACVECGAKVGEPGTFSTQSGDEVPSGRNTLSFQEDKNTRKFDASLTDSAMQALGSVFGDLFAQRGTVRAAQQFPILPPTQSPTFEAGRLPAPPPAIAPDEPTIPPADVTTTPVTEANPDKVGVLRIFSSNGDKLELMDNRLKASNASDYVRRLTYLFLYAHECHGRMSVAEQDLNALIQTAKMMDPSGNARTWIRKRIGIADEGEGRLKLTFKGREDAQNALRNAVDTNIPDVWNPDKVPPKPKGTKAKKKV
jgi:hypothetical protein